ncbi:His-Xaa-Ser system protein HxsD [Pseudomonas fluorescens]|uniref:His-Xaa-Ser system protein HxsD n=1 Tax=Pseudomonas fluorescens TaxID=294 RepID=UPI001A9E1303|nr:His-Xaa-Ser system protein HxsD [Pseudomonas fluorescens]QTD30622.1 His-Xaa-Ser system protein HxsD [Pseudomonas fluorescens]
MTWPVTLSLSDAAYSLSVVQRSVYSLAETLAIQIDIELNRIVLTIFPSESDLTLSADRARALVLQHLNDFALRDHISRETAGLREVLARAALTGCGIAQ